MQTYKDRFFSILGDSLSTLAGFNPAECAVFYDWQNKRLADIYAPEDTWWGKVIDALGGRLLVNHAYSGSLVCKHPACEVESYGCSDARTSAMGLGAQAPDVVMILMGTNDWGAGMQLYPGNGKDGLNVFSVAYETMLEKIRNRYPRAEIWCLTLPRSCWRSHPDFVVPEVYAGVPFHGYCQVIRESGAKFGCRVVEICDPQNPYDTIDGFHPTAVGMQTIADAVLKSLREGGVGCDH